MKKVILYIDGENLRHYIENVLKKNHVPQKDLSLLKVNLAKLFNKVIKELKVDNKFYYSAKLKQHRDTLKKSKELIQKQRALKTKLEKENFDFNWCIVFGNSY